MFQLGPTMRLIIVNEHLKLGEVEVPKESQVAKVVEHIQINVDMVKETQQNVEMAKQSQPHANVIKQI
jgi:hypothetical protein